MKIISIAAAMVLAANAFAQTIYVVQVNVIPASPLPGDNIRIALETGTPYLGANMGHSFVLSQDTVYIMGCFMDGVATQPVTYYDTVTVGALPAGTYHVRYEARISGNGECDSLYGNDWGQADFQVGILSVGEQDDHWGVNLFPNPAAHFQSITIKGTGSEKLEIDLFDMQGRCIRNVYTGFAAPGETTVSTNVADLFYIRCVTCLHTYYIHFGYVVQRVYIRVTYIWILCITGFTYVLHIFGYMV